jgi:rhodanese-related sulfurtransferase
VVKGSIKGAVNLELGGDVSISEAAKQAQLASGNADPRTRYICFCRGGFRSSISASFLRRDGYLVDDIKYGYAVVQQEIKAMCT